jgi:hypothetical protein
MDSWNVFILGLLSIMLLYESVYVNMFQFFLGSGIVGLY